MDGRQTVVAAGGAALIAANFWTGPQRASITGGIFGSGSTQTAHKDLVKVGGEILFVVAATIISGISDRFAAVMVVLIVGLWVLWALNRYAPARKGGTVQPGATGPTGIVKGAAA